MTAPQVPRRTVLALAAAAAVPSAWGQRAATRIRRIAYLSAASRESSSSIELLAAFRERLRELGYTEQVDIAIDSRWADGDAERLKTLARELAALKPDVFVANATPGVEAARLALNGAAPIVMVMPSDPVGSGFIDTFARPGRNITGLTDFGIETAAKIVEISRSVVPGLTTLGVLVSDNPVHPLQFDTIRQAAERTAVRAVATAVRSVDGVDRAFAELSTQGARAAITLGGPPQNSLRERIAAAAIRSRVASIGLIRPYAEAGALLAYGPDVPAIYREAAAYVDKILRGARASELPVQQPRDLELILNLRTARALGLQIPHAVLLQAKVIIE